MAEPETITESGDNDGVSCCHPAHKLNRFIALFFICFLCFGSYFCYDTPGALQGNFKNDLHLSTQQFGMLYSIYSWPNVVLCFIGGYLIDRFFGIRLGVIIYMTILLSGAVLFATGAYINAFWLMMVGRFIFGIGGESLTVGVNNYCVQWFKGKELNMVFGLQLSFARVGSTVNFLIMEPIYKSISASYVGSERMGVVLYLASLTCVFSLTCGLLLGWMDYRAEKVLVSRQTAQNNNEPVKLGDIRHFKGTFWLLSTICVTYYVAIFPFIALGQLFFERKFDYATQDANVVNSIVYILSAALSPVFGFLIDKTGRNVYWIILSILLTVTAHGTLAFTFINPLVGMCLMGIAYSMLASGLWPMVSLIVPEHQLGSAYGICQSVQNLGLALVMMLSGLIVDKYGYLMLEMFFLSFLFVSLMAALIIYLVDSSSNGILNLSPTERKRVQEKRRPGESLRNDDDDVLVNNDANEHTESDGESLNPVLAQSERIRNRYIEHLLTTSTE